MTHYTNESMNVIKREIKSKADEGKKRKKTFTVKML